MAAGEYAQRTQIRRRDELGRLADSMDVLSRKLVDKQKNFGTSWNRAEETFFQCVPRAENAHYGSQRLCGDAGGRLCGG